MNKQRSQQLSRIIVEIIARYRSNSFLGRSFRQRIKERHGLGFYYVKSCFSLFNHFRLGSRLL